MDTSDFPQYGYPWTKVAGLISSVLTRKQRSFRCDALAAIQRVKPPMRIMGVENVPMAGPCIVTFNHYYRPGFRAWWLALGIAAVLPMEMHWIMTNEWTFPGRWYAPMGKVISRRIAMRLANIYGFTPMPPMPPRLQDTTARAEAVRAVLSYVRRGENPVLGLAPEGSDGADGRLSWPPPGVGRFILLLANLGMRIIPVGAFEENGEFLLSFGEAYELNLPPDLPVDQKDRQAARIVMESIAGQLPHRLRGTFC